MAPLLHIQCTVCITENTPLLGLLGVILRNIQYSRKSLTEVEADEAGLLKRWITTFQCKTTPGMPSTSQEQWYPILSVFMGGFSSTEQNHYCVSSDDNTYKRRNWSLRGRGRGVNCSFRTDKLSEFAGICADIVENMFLFLCNIADASRRPSLCTCVVHCNLLYTGTS